MGTNAQAAASSRITRIACGQMTACGDQEANLATCTQLAQQAKAAGARMLFLPECFSFIGTNQAEVRVCAVHA